MEAAHTSARSEKAGSSHGSERKCLVTGEVRPKDELIRFVASPDHSIVPDLAQNLPGRGLWVMADREAIKSAARKNLFSKAAKSPVKADLALADQVAQLMHKRCLEFLGLGRRAGIAILGQPQVEAALKPGKLGLLFMADDAGTDLLSFRADMGIAVCRRFTRGELGAAFGHDQIVYAGLKPHALTVKLTTELARLEKIAEPHHISHTGNETQ